MPLRRGSAGRRGAVAAHNLPWLRGHDNGGRARRRAAAETQASAEGSWEKQHEKVQAHMHFSF